MEKSLKKAILYDKVKACWCGKNIGGTLGAKYEGVMRRLDVKNLDDIGKNGPVPNDDLDLQLVNLHTLETHGLFFSTKELSEEWAEHVYFPYDEYGYALANIRRHLVAPLSGNYNNPFIDCMGSCIRSEIWAAIAPGNPDIAVYYSYLDANVDHSGGEGVYGEVFFAALESLAFVNDNLSEIIYKSLEYLPADCRVYMAVRDTVKWFELGVSYDEIRDLILDKYANPNFTDAPQNIAFTIVALLYCSDFEDGLLKALNLGYDTDCTCATFGSIYGILHGTRSIGDKLYKAVGDNITVSPEVRGFNYPKTITELTNRTIEISRDLSKCDLSLFQTKNDDGSIKQVFYVPCDHQADNSLNISIVGIGSASVVKGKEKLIEITYCNNTRDVWEFNASIEGKSLNGDTFKLASGEHITVPYQIMGKQDFCMMANYRLVISRLHNGQLWKNYNVDFTLPVSSVWNIDGVDTYCEDGCVNFNSIGMHTAETTLNIPSDRRIKIICASNDPVTVFIDGIKRIESSRTGFYMPAYHRCPLDQQIHMDIKKGVYKIKAVIESTSKNSKLMLIPASSDDTPNGKNAYFIDCTIGSEY